VAQDVELAVGASRFSSIAPVALVEALPTSASSNSMPFGMSIRTRCSSPVAGLTIGRPAASSRPGMATFARRRSVSTSNSIGA
jgi:hypothetical protein